MQGNPAPFRPAVERSHVSHHARIVLQQGENCRNAAAGRIESSVCGENGLMCLEPRPKARRGAALRGYLLVGSNNGVSITPDEICIGSVVSKRRRARPSLGQKPKATQRECFSQSFLNPLARVLRLRVRLPTVAKHVAEFVPKLVSEVTPVALADDEVDPGGRWVIGVQPYRWRAAGAILDAELFWLPLGQQIYTHQAGSAHAFDHGGRVCRRRAAPVPPELEWGGKNRNAGTSRVGSRRLQYTAHTDAKQSEKMPPSHDSSERTVNVLSRLDSLTASLLIIGSLQ